MIKYYKDIFNEVAKELGISYKDVEYAYKSYYHFIVDTIKEFDFNDNILTKEEFNALKKSFNIPSLGKIYAPYDKYAGLKRMNKYYKENIEWKSTKEE